MGSAGAGVHVVWFKRDLRAFDHAPLFAAAASGRVLPLYIVEPDLWREPDASARQWLFIREGLEELSRSLAALGQPLIVRVGRACDVLEALHHEHRVLGLWSHEETGNLWTFRRDREVASWAKARSVPWREQRQTGVERRLRSRAGWAERWDRLMSETVVPAPSALAPLTDIVSDCLPVPRDLGLPEDGCPLRQRGGREAALDLLATFLDHRGRTYQRAMSSPIDGADACSRLSPHFAFGTLSLREAMQATWARMRDLKTDRSPEARQLAASLRSFAGRLHWHCHFMQKLESETSIEVRELHPATRGLRPPEADAALFTAWAQGRTGYPFLDACMRSLAATGWLNFRMRAMVMSFASYNLWLPWRETGLHLARQFTDYEPGIHWPQVQMQSGTTGINAIRIYSVVKQGHDQDPTGCFVRRWVPELGEVPDQFVQEPWAWPGADDVIPRIYPERVVDLRLSTDAAKERIYASRRAKGAGDEASKIFVKHGSRRRAREKQARDTAKRQKKTTTNQLALDFDT